MFGDGYFGPSVVEVELDPFDAESGGCVSRNIYPNVSNLVGKVPAV
jgi:hypothetical protein